MSGAGFKDHFSTRAGAYAEFRPHYPDSLFAWLASVAPGRALAWDAGTGNGQAAVALATHFDQVWATDASEQQIAAAEAHPRVRYGVAREAHSLLEARSCDVVTAAQALHWFDIPAFFAEAQRVLRPGGVIAVWTYARPALDDPAYDSVLQSYVRLMDAWWPPERAMVETGYRDVPFPFDEIAAPATELDMQVERYQLAGYLRTWSARQRYRAAHADDPVDAVERDLATIWPDGERRRLFWPVYIRAGRPPRRGRPL